MLIEGYLVAVSTRGILLIIVSSFRVIKKPRDSTGLSDAVLVISTSPHSPGLHL